MDVSENEIGLREARTQLGDIANRAYLAGQTTYLMRNGRRIAAIVPIESTPQEQDMTEDAASGKIIDTLTEQARHLRWIADEQLAQHGPAEHPDSMRADAEADAAEVMLAWALRTTQGNVPDLDACITQAHDLIHDERTRARQRRMFPNSPMHT